MTTPVSPYLLTQWPTPPVCPYLLPQIRFIVLIENKICRKSVLRMLSKHAKSDLPDSNSPVDLAHRLKTREEERDSLANFATESHAVSPSGCDLLGFLLSYFARCGGKQLILAKTSGPREIFYVIDGLLLFFSTLLFISSLLDLHRMRSWSPLRHSFIIQSEFLCTALQNIET